VRIQIDALLQGLHGVISACTDLKSCVVKQMSPYCKKHCFLNCSLIWVLHLQEGEAGDLGKSMWCNAHRDGNSSCKAWCWLLHALACVILLQLQTTVPSVIEPPGPLLFIWLRPCTTSVFAFFDAAIAQ
jgi:hypothetical protein